MHGLFSRVWDIPTPCGSVSVWLWVTDDPSTACKGCMGLGFQLWLGLLRSPWGRAGAVGLAYVETNTWSIAKIKCASLRGRGLVRFSGKRLNLRSFPSYCYAFEFLPRRWQKGFIFVFERFEFKWCLYFEYGEVKLHFIPALVLCGMSENLWISFCVFLLTGIVVN